MTFPLISSWFLLHFVGVVIVRGLASVAQTSISVWRWIIMEPFLELCTATWIHFFHVALVQYWVSRTMCCSVSTIVLTEINCRSPRCLPVVVLSDHVLNIYRLYNRK